MRTLRVPCLLLCLALVCALSAAAQLVKPQAIRIEGTTEYSVPEIVTATGLKTGQAYSSDDLNHRAQHLLASGVFEKVGYKFDGVDLIFLLTVNSQLYPIAFDNLPLDPGPNLVSQLRTRVPLFHGLVPTEGTTLDELCRALEAMLAEQGFKANVTAAPAGNASAHLINAMRFTIPSPALRVGSLQFEGLSAAMDAKVTEMAKHFGGAYETGKTEALLQHRVESLYLNDGYAAVKVAVRIIGPPTDAGNTYRIPFGVKIEEGKTYKLGIVSIARGTPVDQAELEKMTGSRSRFTPENAYLNAVVNGLDRQLKSRGYLDSVVTPHPTLDDAAGVVNYVVTADPGPVYHLAFVKFQDVNDDLRTLLMRTWQMLPGDAFNESYVGNFMMQAQKSDGALKQALAGMKATYDVRADPETHDVNLVIRLEKQ